MLSLLSQVPAPKNAAAATDAGGFAARADGGGPGDFAKALQRSHTDLQAANAAEPHPGSSGTSAAPVRAAPAKEPAAPAGPGAASPANPAGAAAGSTPPTHGDRGETSAGPENTPADASAPAGGDDAAEAGAPRGRNAQRRGGAEGRHALALAALRQRADLSRADHPTTAIDASQTPQPEAPDAGVDEDISLAAGLGAVQAPPLPTAPATTADARVTPGPDTPALGPVDAPPSRSSASLGDAAALASATTGSRSAPVPAGPTTAASAAQPTPSDNALQALAASRQGVDAGKAATADAGTGLTAPGTAELRGRQAPPTLASTGQPSTADAAGEAGSAARMAPAGPAIRSGAPALQPTGASTAAAATATTGSTEAPPQPAGPSVSSPSRNGEPVAGQGLAAVAAPNAAPTASFTPLPAPSPTTAPTTPPAAGVTPSQAAAAAASRSGPGAALRGVDTGLPRSEGRPSRTAPAAGPRPVADEAATRRDDAAQALAAGTQLPAAGGSAGEADSQRSDTARDNSPAGANANTGNSGNTSNSGGLGGSATARFADAFQALLPSGTVAPAAATGAGAAPAAVPSAHLPTALYSPDFAPALGAQVTLFARGGVQQARIDLNPAEMGPISVQIVMDGSSARVDFHAEVAATRQVIESALPALASSLRDAGMTLTGGGVFQQDPLPSTSANGQAGPLLNGQGGSQDGGHGQGSGQRDTGRGARGHGADDGGLQGGPGGTGGISTVLRPGPGRGLVDLVA